MRSRLSETIGFTLFVAVLGVTPAAAQEVGQEAAQTHQEALNACAEAVVADFEAAYPKAKRLVWDLSRLTAESSLFGDQLKGRGDYRGKGGKRRTLEFDCTWDPFAGEVVKAVWESSHDAGVVRQAVDLTGDMEILPGKAAGECGQALDARIREDWPTYRELELLEESLERRKTREGYMLRGDGRFQGPARNWHRYFFRCIYDGESVELHWKHHGKEVDE